MPFSVSIFIHAWNKWKTVNLLVAGVGNSTRILLTSFSLSFFFFPRGKNTSYRMEEK